MAKSRTNLFLKVIILLIICVLNFIFVRYGLENFEVDPILFIVFPLASFVVCFMACHGGLNQFMADQVQFIAERNLWNENPFKVYKDSVPHWHFNGWCSLASGFSGLLIVLPLNGPSSNLFLLEVVIGVTILIAQHFSVKLFIWQNTSG